MRIECPHCKNKLNLVDVESADSGGSAACPSCGSVIDALEQTVTQKQDYADTVGHFSLIGQVGVGQFGTVWRARDTVLRRTVAVKIPRESELDGSQRDMFLREAQAAAKLTHEGIVRTLEVGEDESGRIFIVSDFINGITLAEKMKQSRLDVKDAAETMRRVAAAVHHAHEHDVIHRDLKPSNILIDVDGNPYVSDFGLAKQDTGEVTMTVTGMILGTPAYMSPEQAGGFSNKADARSDVYSLGVILYELLTGEKPFKGSTAVLLHEIQSKDPRLPRSIEKTIPRDLETICLKAIHKRPDRRYQTAEEMSQDLGRFLAGDPIKARRITLIERLARKARRNRVATASIITAIVAIAVASLIAATSHSNSKTPITTSRKQITVTLTTEPEGATLVFYRRDDYTGVPILEKAVRPKEKSPVTTKLDWGDYLVVAVLDDGRFHEVFRRVPENPSLIPEWYPHRKWDAKSETEVVLPPIEIPMNDVINGMSFIGGAQAFPIGIDGDPEVPRHLRRIRSFYIDIHEFTFGQAMEVFNGGLPPSLAPKTQYANENPGLPITGLFYDEAVVLAEMSGKRLANEFEFELASRPVSHWKYPFGNTLPEGVSFSDLWTLRNSSIRHFDRTDNDPPVLGLFSNVAEFTSSRAVPYDTKLRFDSGNTPFAVSIRGGPSLDGYDVSRHEKVTTRGRTGIHLKNLSHRVGFRCARSKSPRLTAEDF